MQLSKVHKTMIIANADLALLEAMREDPTDPIPKLLIADWLEERAEPFSGMDCQ